MISEKEMREALITFARLGCGNLIYKIRDKTYETDWSGNSWDHPDVIAWAKASEIANKIYLNEKESNTSTSIE